jgi:hypothetical protein
MQQTMGAWSGEPLTTVEMSQLVGCIYDAAIDPEAWPRAITVICQTLSFQTGVVSVIALPSGKSLISEVVGFDPDWMARLPDYEADLVALWGGEARIHSLPPMNRQSFR